MEVTRFLEMLVTTYNVTECRTTGDKVVHYHFHYTFNKPAKGLGNVKMTNKGNGRMKGKRNEKKKIERQRNRKKKSGKKEKITNNKVNGTNPRKRRKQTKKKAENKKDTRNKAI